MLKVQGFSFLAFIRDSLNRAAVNGCSSLLKKFSNLAKLIECGMWKEIFRFLREMSPRRSPRMLLATRAALGWLLFVAFPATFSSSGKSMSNVNKRFHIITNKQCSIFFFWVQLSHAKESKLWTLKKEKRGWKEKFPQHLLKGWKAKPRWKYLTLR